MNNKTIIVIVIGLLLALFTSYYWFEIRPYIPKYKWNENYTYTSKEPYGLKYFYNSLKDSKKKDEFEIIKSKFGNIAENQKDIRGIYFFIGNKWNVSKSEIDDIISYVGRGNSAFISTTSIPVALAEKLGVTESIESIESATESISIHEFFAEGNFVKKNFIFKHRMLKRDQIYFWTHFQHNFTTELMGLYNLRMLCLQDSDCADFIEIPYEKGKIFLHLSPILFTNYHFISGNGFEYAQNVLSFLPEGKLYWDELSKNQFTSSLNNGQEQSPLRYILSKNSLRWAWYLLISTLILFLLFGAKRRQKPIPLIQENKNSTFEYTKAVAALYLQSGDHTHIANEMWHLFVVFVKIKYNVIIDNSDKPLELTNLSLKSKIPIEFLNDLLKLKNIVCYNWGKDPKVLLEFHNALDHFYKNCN